jgi:hypothetical protein
MNIKSLLLIICVFFFVNTFGQLNNNGMQCISSEISTGPALLNGLTYNGYVHTPKGQLKMLVVFVSSEEDEDDVINLPTLAHLNWYHD